MTPTDSRADNGLNTYQTPEGGNMDEASACEILVNQYPIQCVLDRCDPLICNGIVNVPRTIGKGGIPL